MFYGFPHFTIFLLKDVKIHYIFGFLHPSNAHFSVRFLVKNDFKIIRFTVIQIDLLYVNRFFLIQNTAFVDKSSLSKPAIPTILMTFQQGSYKLNKYLIYLQLNSKRIARTTRGFRTTNKLRRVVLNVILGFFLWSKLAYFR